MRLYIMLHSWTDVITSWLTEARAQASNDFFEAAKSKPWGWGMKGIRLGQTEIASIQHFQLNE